MKILWVYGIHENSGYAQNSRAFIQALNKQGLEVKFLNHGLKEYCEKATMEQYEAPKDFKPDLVIQNVIPPCFERIAGAKNILMTFAETDRVSPAWVKKCNTADEVFTQSYFSKAAFVFSGVTVPVTIAHTPTDVEKLQSVVYGPENHYQKGNDFVYFSNGEWSLRKGQDILINAFYNTFWYCDFARLLIKTCSMNGYETTETIERMIKAGKDKFPGAKCKITLINDITDIESVWKLYKLADCFVLPSRGEAGGIPYFEAAALGIPIVCPSKGGQIDYINSDIALTARSKLVPARRSPHNKNYDESMFWVETDPGDFGYQMMQIAANYDVNRFKQGQERFAADFGMNGNKIKELAEYIKGRF